MPEVKIPFVGQKVFIRQHFPRQEPSVGEFKVSKVGRKFFYIVRFQNPDGIRLAERRYFLDTLREVRERGHPTQCYLSRQDLDDEDERDELAREFRRVFDMHATPELTLDQMRRIKAIIDE